MTDITTATDVSDEFLDGLLGSLSLEQKVRLLTGASFWTLHDEPQIGLETIVVSDGPAGVRGQLWDERDSSASLPSPTSLAASWDVERVHRLGQLIAAEARRKGVGVATSSARRAAAATSRRTARTRGSRASSGPRSSRVCSPAVSVRRPSTTWRTTARPTA